MEKLLSTIATSLLLCAMGSVLATENSIIPAIDNALVLENLPIQKYSHGQNEEIKSALQNNFHFSSLCLCDELS